MSDDKLPDFGEADVDRIGRAAGAELRRPAPHSGVQTIVARARRRRSTHHAVTGALAVVTIVGVGAALVFARDGDTPIHTSTPLPDVSLSTEPFVVPDTPPSTTVPDSAAEVPGSADQQWPGTTEPQTASPSATTAPTVTTRVPSGLIRIGPSTEFLWGDGAVLGAYVDGQFVPYSTEDVGRVFVAPALPAPTDTAPPADPPTQLRNRIAEPADYVMYDEGCGAIIASPAFTDHPEAASGGWLTTAGHRLSTLDGSAQETNAEELDAALRAAGISDDDMTLIERLTPYVSLDDDPSLETLVQRFDPDLRRGPAVDADLNWLAVWDPDSSELISIAGDPGGNATPFAINGEGPIDADGDGRLETTITQGTRVELVRLSDGARLATAERCPHTVEVSLTFSGFGPTPVNFMLTAVSSEQSFPGQASGDGGAAGPFVLGVPLNLTGTYLHVTTEHGRAEVEVLLRTGHNVVTIEVTPASMMSP